MLVRLIDSRYKDEQGVNIVIGGDITVLWTLKIRLISFNDFHLHGALKGVQKLHIEESW